MTSIADKLRRLIIFPGSATQGKPYRMPQAYENLIEECKTHSGNRIALLYGDAISHEEQIPQLSPETYSLIYFYGNAMCISYATYYFDFFRRFGLSVAIGDYVGFGRSSGFATESGCYETAETVYRYITLNKQISPNRIIVAGHSLGAGVAIDLVSKHPEVSGLILFGAFTCIADEAEATFPFIPRALIDLAVPERFDNFNKIGRIKCPIFIGHGTEDEVVPFFMSKRLFSKANARIGATTRFYPIKGAKHNNFLDIGGNQLFESIKEFLISCCSS